MLIDEAEKVITKYWLAQFAIEAPGIPTVFDNDADDESPVYMRFSVVPMPSMQQTLGGETVRVQRFGRVSIKINVPSDNGTKTANQYVNKVNKILERAQLAGSSLDDYVKFGIADPSRPNGDDGEYFTMLVTVPFWFWELKASS